MQTQGRGNEDGSYEFRFEAGERRLKIDIEGTGMQFMGGGFLQQLPAFRSLIVDVQSGPGQRLTKSIEIPKSSGPLRVHFGDLLPTTQATEAWQVNRLSIVARLSSDVTWSYQKDLYPSSQELFEHSVPGVPDTRGFVVARFGNGFDAIAFDKRREATIRFSDKRLGSLTIRPAAGATLDDWDLTLCALVGGQRYFVAWLPARQSSHSTREAYWQLAPTSRIAQRVSPSAASFERIGPGNYQLVCRNEDLTIVRQVRLKEGTQRDVELILPR